MLVKLSPDVADLPGIAGRALEAGADGLTLVNTARALLVDAELRRPLLGAGVGGLSGPALKPIALRAVHEVARAHPGTPIVGTGGVQRGLDAVEMLLAGAHAVGVGTATFLDPRATLRILDELTQLVRTARRDPGGGAERGAARPGPRGDPMSEPRDHLVLALDVADVETARPLARRLAPWFSIVKVGYELYAAAGPAVFDALHEDGFAVFADLKLLDIPTTVERGARALGRRGVDFLNFHAVGGVDMLRAGIEGLAAGARDAGHDRPVALAVTVLTSEPDARAVPDAAPDRADRGVRRGGVRRRRSRRGPRARPGPDGPRAAPRRRRRAGPGPGLDPRRGAAAPARSGSSSAGR